MNRVASNVSFISKVLEKVVLEQSLTYLKNNSVLLVSQSVYHRFVKFKVI